jgi:hypothetical protein
VVTPTGNPGVTLLFTQALSGASATFNSTVRNYIISPLKAKCSANGWYCWKQFCLRDSNWQVGAGTDVRMPVDRLGRNINASDPTGAIGNTTYSVGVWLQEQIRANRKLAMADLINVAGNRVSPGYNSLVAAINDFSADPTVTSLVLGKYFLYPILLVATLE